MLHKIVRSAKYFLFVILFTISCLVACRHDHPANSEEESAYMGDYESPPNKWGFINKEGQLVIKATYDDVGPFSEGFAAVNKDGKWGFIDRKGNIVIQPIYKSAWAFHEKKARVQQFDQPEQFIDQKGTAMHADGWSAADDFSNGRARVKVGNSFGYIDSTGHLVIQPIYTRGWNFNNDICIVEYQEKLGVIDLKGAYILKPEYDFIKIAGKNKIILSRLGNTSMAHDATGKELARIPEGKMSDSDGHLISVREGNKMYLFDVSTKAAIKPEVYTNIIYLEDSLWAGKTSEGYLLLDHEGQPLTSTAYKQINKFSDGLAAYGKGEFWGYMDKTGLERTNDVFGLAWDYREGLARAAFKDGIAFIDQQQNLAFYPPLGSVDMRDFSEGLASVQME